MVGHCKCGKVKWNMHNNNLCEIPWMCLDCKEINRKKYSLAPEPRGPSRPFDDYNPRPKKQIIMSKNLQSVG